MKTMRPSATATKIARFMILLDSVPRLAPLLPAGAAQTAESILRASGAVRLREIAGMRKPFTARLYEWTEALLGRGQLVWFGLRKRWLAQVVEESIATGTRQLLVLGAGFDPLAVQTARAHPEVLCVEVDAPSTALPKRKGIERAGLSAPNHWITAVDLGESSLADVLGRIGWSTGVPTVVVAEGLLMYLSRQEVVDLFASVRAVSAPNTRFAFTLMDADEAGQPRIAFTGGPLGAAVRLALRAVGEELRWGIRPEAVADFIGSLGFRVLEQPALSVLRSRFLDPVGLRDEPVSPYEHLCLAESTPRQHL